VKYENKKEVRQNLGFERRIDGEVKKFQKVPGRSHASERPPVIAVVIAQRFLVRQGVLDRHQINPA
jgi:hypothetical protein